MTCSDSSTYLAQDNDKDDLKNNRQKDGKNEAAGGTSAGTVVESHVDTQQSTAQGYSRYQDDLHMRITIIIAIIYARTHAR